VVSCIAASLRVLDIVRHCYAGLDNTTAINDRKRLLHNSESVLAYQALDHLRLKGHAMLSDTIMSYVGSAIDAERTGFMITRFAEQIVEAERFSVSPQVMEACQKLAYSKPSSMLDATKFCRAPFKKTWLEWEGRIPGRGNQVNEASGQEEPAPKRFGVLVEALDDTYRRLGVTFAWEHHNQNALNGVSINLCPLGYVINWEDKWTPNTDPEPLKIKGMYEKYVGDEKEFQAMKEFAGMCSYTIVPYSRTFIENLRAESEERFAKLLKYSQGDLEGEAQLLVSVLCLLNAKNCVSREPIDVTKPNKLRRLRGKKPLLSYSNVEINLSRRDAEYARQSGMSDIEIRRHIVRGHFKVRKTGVYWWRPFLRGDASLGEVRRSGYTFVDRKTA